MKKFIVFFLMFLAVMIVSLQAQKVSNYSYKLDNGINIKTERCWNHVWVDQRFDPVKAQDKTPPVTVNARTLGSLSAGFSFKLFSAGKEVKVAGAKPGTYSLKLVYKLSGKPGSLSFQVDDVVIKPGSNTTVGVTLYEYQILIEETPGSHKGMAYYESKVNRFQGNTEQNLNRGLPSFYAKGSHDNAIKPDEPLGDNYGRIKAGTYDVLISIEIAGRTQKVWLENFTMKPDVKYAIATNLNGGVITYTGGNKEVKIMHLYPAGTAAANPGKPAPVKNAEIIAYESLTFLNACPPGSYDVLLNFGQGVKYEWRNNIVVKTGGRTEVK